MSKRWTKQEIDFLKKSASTMDDSDVALMLGRTKESVSIKRARMKIGHHTNWTKEQECLLVENIEKMKIKDLCELLGKTESSIINKKHILGIKTGRKKYNNENLAKICHDYSPEITYLRHSRNNKGTIILELECACGKVFTVEKYELTNKGRIYCKECLKERRKGVKVKFEKEKMFVQSNSKCKLLDIFHKENNQRYGIYYELRCECGNTFQISKQLFKNTRNICNECFDEANRSSMYKKVLYRLIEDGYELLTPVSEYRNGSSKLIVRDCCGYMYETTFYNYKTSNLMKFGSKNRYTIDNIKTYIKLNVIDYELLSNEFISATDKLKFKCNNGHEFDLEWCRFYEGSRCKYCSSSSPEILTHEILRRNNIIFDTEYVFKNMINPKTGYHLRVDVVIFNDGDIYKAIEINGKHHYQPVDYYCHNKADALNHYNEVVYRDKIKMDFLEDKDIDCIVIPYWDFNNIEQILTKELNL